MKKINTVNNSIAKRIAIGALVLGLIVTASAAFSHGGKHSGKGFTHLQALQKATGLYNRRLNRANSIPVGKRS